MKNRIGIGLRRDFADEMATDAIIDADFIEIAPENWMGMGGHWKRVLDQIGDRLPIFSHGLSLSIGSPDELDMDFLRRMKLFLEQYNVEIYSEHLSYSKSNNAHLFDLLPIPFRQDAVDHISDRIKKVQDFLGRELVIEIVSYYTPVAAEMPEVEFINRIVEKSQCGLLLDVNNVYVNAFNHKYDAKQFINELLLSSVRYIHMAGHEQVAEDLIIDTHGQDIIDPVYDLFEFAVQKTTQVPVLLERDFNIPDLAVLQHELSNLRRIADRHWHN